jgi:hypothetical protein
MVHKHVEQARTVCASAHKAQKIAMVCSSRPQATFLSTDCSLLSQVPKGQHRHRSCPHLSNSCGSEFLALPTVLQSHYDPTSWGNQREPHFRHLAGIPAPRSSYLSARGGRPPAKTQSHLIEAVCIESSANNATHKLLMMHTPHTGRSGVRGEGI